MQLQKKGGGEGHTILLVLKLQRELENYSFWRNMLGPELLHNETFSEIVAANLRHNCTFKHTWACLKPNYKHLLEK